MKAVTWCGKKDVRVADVEDPKILRPHDAIIRVTRSAICGSDVHLYDGYVPTMKKGDILGHEAVGEVVEVGKEVYNLVPGDRVAVPFPISCGQCWYCKQGLWSLCDNTNPNAWMMEKAFGHSTAGVFGYSHMFGGYAGGQAEYLRVPFANVGPLKLPNEITYEQALTLCDVFPTGYQAAESCNIHTGDVIAVWGCGPIGQFAVRSAFMLGAARVLAIDNHPARLELAAKAGAEIVDFSKACVFTQLMEATGGRGPDACIDAVGLEAHGTTPDAIYDTIKVGVRMATGHAHALREAIMTCRKGGTISIIGVYAGLLDKFPMGAAFNKGLTFRMGQAHVQRYMRPLLDRILSHQIDPSFIFTHRFALDDAPKAYEVFSKKQDNCIKVVLQP